MLQLNSLQVNIFTFEIYIYIYITFNALSPVARTSVWQPLLLFYFSDGSDFFKG